MKELREDFLNNSVSYEDLRLKIATAAPLDYSALNNLGEDQPTLFETLLEDASTENQYRKLQFLFDALPGHVPYQRSLVERVYGNDPAHGLEYLCRLYQNGHVRDPNPDANTPHEHLIQTLILLEWVEGIRHVLTRDQTLVNVAALNYSADRGKRLSPSPLLLFAMMSSTTPAVTLALLEFDPTLSLIDETGSTILHLLAINVTLCDQFPDLVKEIFSRASDKLKTDKDDFGFTPADYASDPINAVVLNLLPKATLGLPETVPFFTVPTAVQATLIETNFAPTMPGLDLGPMLASLIGKGKPVKLFFNMECLLEYLEALKKIARPPFVVNAIVMVIEGHHAINVLCIAHQDGSTDALVIDSLGLQNKSGILNALPLNVKMLSTQLLHTDKGCKVIASYLASKLSRLTPAKAISLFQSLPDQTPSLEHFPNWLGLMTICQSFSAIEAAKERQSTAQREAPVNKRGETLDQVLARGTGVKFCVCYTDQANYAVNRSLERKAKNQARHALKFTALTPKEKSENVARVLGFMEMNPGWRKTMPQTLAGLTDFESLEEVRFTCGLTQ